MGKKIYVNGGILVNTRFFACKNATCLCGVVPDDALYIDPPLYKKEYLPNQEEVKCLVIHGEKPEKIACPKCGSENLQKWNPRTGKCPKCGGEMKKTDIVIMVD